MRNGFKAISIAMLCSISTGALAQATADTAAPATAPPPTDTKSVAEGGLEDIVVTATRREERLQEIPVTVTAVTAQTLIGSGIVDVRRLTQVVPGYSGNRTSSVIQPFIRGVGSAGISVGDEPNVATLRDTVVITSEELRYDARTREISSSRPFVFDRPGHHLEGNGFVSDPDFANIRAQQPHGGQTRRDSTPGGFILPGQ